MIRYLYEKAILSIVKAKRRKAAAAYIKAKDKYELCVQKSLKQMVKMDKILKEHGR